MSENKKNLLFAVGVMLVLIAGVAGLLSMGSMKDETFARWCADRDMTTLRRNGQLYCHRADGALFYPPVSKS